MADVRITSIDQLQLGMFVKLIDRDDNGRFSHTGKITDINIDTKKPKKIEPGEAGFRRDHVHIFDHSFEMLTMEGTMGFEMGVLDNNDLYITTVKPPGWAKFEKNPSSFNEESTKPLVPIKTKKELVLALVAENPRKGEGALLKLATKTVGGSEGQLRTYIKLGLSKK